MKCNRAIRITFKNQFRIDKISLQSSQMTILIFLNRWLCNDKIIGELIPSLKYALTAICMPCKCTYLIKFRSLDGISFKNFPIIS